jgi:hypothetical protein
MGQMSKEFNSIWCVTWWDQTKLWNPHFLKTIIDNKVKTCVISIFFLLFPLKMHIVEYLKLKKFILVYHQSKNQYKLSFQKFFISSRLFIYFYIKLKNFKSKFRKISRLNRSVQQYKNLILKCQSPFAYGIKQSDARYIFSRFSTFKPNFWGL